MNGLEMVPYVFLSPYLGLESSYLTLALYKLSDLTSSLLL